MTENNLYQIYMNGRRSGRSLLMKYYRIKTIKQKNEEKEQKRKIELLNNKNVLKENKKFFRGIKK